MGKTAFALNVTLDIAIKYNIPVIFFSLEMTKYQLMYRLLTIETKINTNRIKTAQLNEIEWKNVNKAVKKLSNLPLYIDDTGTISLSEIHFRIQKIKLQFGKIGFVVIDYLQLLETVQKNENRVQEISKITRSLKGFAREFDTPIFVLSQLSRNVESRTNKRPILSDLRESGCIYFNDCLSSNLNQIGVYQHNKNLIMKTKKFKIKSSGLKPVFLVKNFINLTTNLTANHKLLTNLKWQRIDECNYLTIGKFSFFLPKKNLKSIFQFFYNSFILHNSIEQDADIVLMLYRDEYYYEKTENKGIAELIIAKHRNGPVGTIQLGFNNSLTKFFNFS
ncbi:unnamed protein product [Heterosigma akashiwo]